MPPKKVPFNPFKSRTRARSAEPPGQLKEEDAGIGEFRDTQVSFAPVLPKADAAITITFRCTVRLVRGDIITIKLAGFKGAIATTFSLEQRPHPENRDFRDSFHGYWAGEAPPKGGPGAQTVTLLVRKPIEQNALVIIGIPDAVHISLPEKLGLNSAKLKIDGIVRHSNGPGPNGKIPKAPIAACPELKKKPGTADDDLAQLEAQVKAITEDQQLQLDEDELQAAFDTSLSEADHIWEAARDLSELKLGLNFRIDPTVFGSYAPFAAINEMIIESYKAATKKRSPLALHKELATNLGVQVGLIVILEDVFYMLHGGKYPELSRGAVLVLRLWTCEPHDICRLLCVPTAPSIQREIMSALRALNAEVVGNWAIYLGTLMTCCGKLTHLSQDLIPPLFRGQKDLTPEATQHLLSLKKDSWYVFPSFTHLIPEARFNDENASIPDNAVVFEVHKAVEAIELGDISQYPQDGEWMLPMFSSFSVVSVEQLPEKNNVVHVVLLMRGSLAGPLRDDQFPENDRSLIGAVIKNAKSTAALSSMHSHAVAKLIYANLRSRDLKAVHPDHVVHMQYLDKFADVKRASVARQQVEEGVIRWQACVDAYVAGGDPFNPRAATWESVVKKHATTIEALFLKRTRAMKQFTADGVTVDFQEFVADFGKGQKRIRRLVGKNPTHPYQS